MAGSRGTMGIEFNFGGSGASPPGGRRPQPDAPFRIAVLADLSGRGSRGLTDPIAPPALAARRAYRVDIDNLDQTIAALGVIIRTSAGGATVDVPIASLDDFHPDSLFRSLEVFAPLRTLRARLLDPATSDAAAAEARALLSIDGPPPNSGPDAAAPTPSPGSTGGPDLLESLLGGKVASGGAAPPTPAAAPTNVADIVRRLARSAQTDAVKAPSPEHGSILAALDHEIASLMRTIMHSRAFQSVEATWRAIHTLITSVSTDESLTIDLFDVSKAELAADLQRAAAAGSFESASLARLLLDRSTNTPGEGAWSLIVADVTLDFTTPDAALGAFLASVGSRCGAPVVVAASPAHVGCPSLALSPDPESWTLRPPAGDDAAPATWGAVRRTPEAPYLAMAMPRWLARLPYGPGGETAESFVFTEIPAPALDHESRLWANPAYALAILIAQAFSEDGADMTLPDAGEVTGLPVHSYSHRGETVVTPCAEAWLTLKASHAIQTAGISPLLSIKGRDAARVAVIQSIADPLTPLAGRWD